jgi:hypothetical protein
MVDPRFGMPGVVPGIHGGHFGGDLDPFAGGGMGGMVPGHGGTHMGPDHPMFAGRVPGGGLGGPLGGPGKGKGGLPPGHPPGARFDPFGPVVPGGVPRGKGKGKGKGEGMGFGGPTPDHFRMPEDDGPPDGMYF